MLIIKASLLLTYYYRSNAFFYQQKMEGKLSGERSIFRTNIGSTGYWNQDRTSAFDMSSWVCRPAAATASLFVSRHRRCEWPKNWNPFFLFLRQRWLNWNSDCLQTSLILHLTHCLSLQVDLCWTILSLLCWRFY